MSVCNLYVTEEKISCLSDTMSYAKHKPVALTPPKTQIIADAGIAWCFRGQSRIGKALDFTFNHDRYGILSFNRNVTIDDIHEYIEFSRDVISECFALDSVAEVVFMGWSELHGKARALEYRFLTDGSLSDPMEHGPGVHLKPAGPASMKMPERVDETIMVKLALAQHQVAERFRLPLCIGGVMHLTTVTEDGAERRIVGAYPDYQAHAQRFGCPNAEDYALFIESQQFQAGEAA